MSGERALEILEELRDKYYDAGNYAACTGLGEAITKIKEEDNA